MELNLSERSIALLRSSVIDFTMSPAQRLFGRETVLPQDAIGPFIRGKIRRELYHLYEHVLSNKTRLS